MTMPNKVVVLNKVSKSYNRILALDAVSFDINEGEVFGYIGPNGAGKTTSIKILVGLTSDFSGEISVDGNNISQIGNELNKKIGYMPQEIAFQEWRTVDHVLTTFGKLSGLNKTDLSNRIPEILELVGLEKERHKKVIHLSGGMKQKLGFGQAILHKPKLLVLDEPLAGLDPKSRIQVKSIIQNLTKNGVTVFFSSHILSDVQDVASKIGILSKGKIKKIGTLDELKSHFCANEEIEIELSYNANNWQSLTKIEEIINIVEKDKKKLLVQLDADTDVDEIAHKILSTLIKTGNKIRRFSPIEPSLDQLYLKYESGGLES